MQTVFDIANFLIDAQVLFFSFLLPVGRLNERGNIAAKAVPFNSSRPNLNDTANALNGMIA